MYVYYHGIIDHSGIAFKVGYYMSEYTFLTFTITCRGCGSNRGSQTAFSMTITTSTFMLTLDLTLSCGINYTALTDRRIRSTGRTFSGERERMLLLLQGKCVSGVMFSLKHFGFREELEEDIGERKDENPLAYDSNKHKYL